jgi:hypothetical protein
MPLPLLVLLRLLEKPFHALLHSRMDALRAEDVDHAILPAFIDLA